MPNMYITKEYGDFGFDEIVIKIPVEKEEYNYLKVFFNEVNFNDELNQIIKTKVIQLLSRESTNDKE